MSGYESKHYPFLSVEELNDLFKALSGYTGSSLIVLAARLLILTGLCTGELRSAFWSEIDIEKVVWEIPTERMKMKRPHLVILSSQALEIVQQLKVMSGQYPLVFLGRNDPRKTMSSASLIIGYSPNANMRDFPLSLNR